MQSVAEGTQVWDIASVATKHPGAAWRNWRHECTTWSHIAKVEESFCQSQIVQTDCSRKSGGKLADEMIAEELQQGVELRHKMSSA